MLNEAEADGDVISVRRSLLKRYAVLFKPLDQSISFRSYSVFLLVGP